MAAEIEWEEDEGDFWDEDNISIGIWVTQIYVSCQNSVIVLLRFVHFTVCKFYLKHNFKQILNSNDMCAKV